MTRMRSTQPGQEMRAGRSSHALPQAPRRDRSGLYRSVVTLRPDSDAPAIPHPRRCSHLRSSSKRYTALSHVASGATVWAMSGPANSLLQPAGGARNALAPQQVRDAIERREADGPLAIGPSGRRPLAALHDLHAALAHETRFQALASVLPDLPEAEDNWYIATRIAEEARIDDEVGRAVAFLLGEHNTSGATRSPFAIALVLATAAAFAVPEHGAQHLAYACRRAWAPLSQGVRRGLPRLSRCATAVDGRPLRGSQIRVAPTRRAEEAPGCRSSDLPRSPNVVVLDDKS
jgi:hypothetical protein